MATLPTLTELEYNDLKDEEVVERGSWDKDTVRWASTHKAEIRQVYRAGIRMYGKKGFNIDPEDFFQEVMRQLYYSQDYDPIQSVERSKTGEMVPIKGYVEALARRVLLRLATTEGKIQSKQILESQHSGGDDDDELSIFNITSDKTTEEIFDRLTYDLDEILDLMEPYRYRFGTGIDIIELVYIQLNTLAKNVDRQHIEDYLSLKGITAKMLRSVRESQVSGVPKELMHDLAKAIAHHDVKISLGKIRKRVYCANWIDKVMIAS